MRFALRRDLYRRLSACPDGPSGRDIDCRIDIRVGLMPAGHAPEDRLALAVLRHAMPADTAGLRRIRRIHFLDPPRGLVLQPTDQAAPAIGQRCPDSGPLWHGAVRQLPPGRSGSGFGLGRLVICRCLSRTCSRSDSLGHARSSPVDNAADTVTPRSTPTTSPVPGARIGSGMTAHLRLSVRTRDAWPPTMRETLVHPGLAPRRSSADTGVEVLDGLVEVPQRLLLHGLRPCRSQSNTARAWVSCRACSTYPGVAPLSRVHIDHCSSARFHTWRACRQCSSNAACCAGVGYIRNRDTEFTQSAGTDSP